MTLILYKIPFIYILFCTFNIKPMMILSNNKLVFNNLQILVL